MSINRCVCTPCKVVFISTTTFYPLFLRACFCGGSLETYRKEVHWYWERAALANPDLLLIDIKEVKELGLTP